jgi:LacI family transcriptional regulator
MATIRDVAKLAGVSVATVSRVLNGTAKVSDEARHAVLSAQEALNFHLNENARALAQHQSQTVGVLVSSVDDPYFANMIKACDETAWKHGKMVLVTQGYYDAEREEMALNAMISRQCAGLIVHAIALSDETMIRYMKQFPCMVLVNRLIKGFEERCVNIDNVGGMELAVNELIAAGRRKIAYVNSSLKILDAGYRCHGYLRALEKAGIKPDPTLVIRQPPTLEGGARAALELLPRISEIDGISCYNDALASGIMNTLLTHGIDVPGQVSVTGFDDLPLARVMHPALTTVTNPSDEIGRCATELTLALQDGKPYSLPRFETRLIRRGSVVPKR